MINLVSLKLIVNYGETTGDSTKDSWRVFAESPEKLISIIIDPFKVAGDSTVYLSIWRSAQNLGIFLTATFFRITRYRLVSSIHCLHAG